jgi:hypothetical protein
MQDLEAYIQSVIVDEFGGDAATAFVTRLEQQKRDIILVKHPGAVEPGQSTPHDNNR